ncbi:MAG: patatin-like phospholipase family protein [Romboutsia sp.]
MRIGLCLSGGGAKGSYQAGVIKGLYDNGINKFSAISGTSIGAVNGYYIYTGNVNNLEKVWINIQTISENGIKILDNAVDNSEVIDKLKPLTNNLRHKMDFYVNYIKIENKGVEEVIVNVSKQDYKEGLDSVKYSSLLPYNPLGQLPLKDQFEKDLYEGLYDGCKLDGGMVNNTLIEPLIEDNVDKIIVISTRHDYILPEDIKYRYNEDDIIIVRPKTIFGQMDTLRFESAFCKRMFEEGYEIGKNINI